MSVIMPVSVNGELSVGYVDQSVPCIAASNYNNNQQAYAAGFVQSVLPEVAEPSAPQVLPQHIASSLNASSVPRVARPILGAAASLGLPPGNLDKSVTANMPADSAPGKSVVGSTGPITVDVILPPARPPSNSENIPNGRHWPPALDSPNCMRSMAVGPPSSSPTMMQQPLPADAVTANPTPQFLPPPYCFVTPAVGPSTTMPTSLSTSGSTVVAPAAGNPASSGNLCTAGCCHCGQCQATAPPVGPYTYTYPPFMIPGIAPFLPGFGYAIPGLPFPPPTLPPVSYGGTYTQSSELVYNNQPVFTVMHQFQRPPPPAQAPIPPLPNAGHGLPPLKPSPVVTVPFNPMMPPPSAHVAGGRRIATKNSSCFNCGLIGHQASMCPEPLMSSSAHTGTACLLTVIIMLLCFFSQGSHASWKV